jgi:hypothetical protein
VYYKGDNGRRGSCSGQVPRHLGFHLCFILPSIPPCGSDAFLSFLFFSFLFFSFLFFSFLFFSFLFFSFLFFSFLFFLSFFLFLFLFLFFFSGPPLKTTLQGDTFPFAVIHGHRTPKALHPVRSAKLTGVPPS